MTSVVEITQLLARSSNDRDAATDLFRAVEQRLTTIAKSRLRREHRPDLVEPTLLVDDAFQKLMAQRGRVWNNREQFFTAAAKVMQNLLVENARRQLAAKRGLGEAPQAIDDADHPVDRRYDPAEVVALGDLIEALEQKLPRAYQVFALRYFWNFNVREIAEEVLGISETIVKERWNTALSFLKSQFDL